MSTARAADATKHRESDDRSAEATPPLREDFGRVLPLVFYPEAVLREACPPVHKEDIGAPERGVGNSSGPPPPPSLAQWLQELVSNLRATASFHDALGLASPQIGATARVFVMRRPYKLLAPGSAPGRSFEVCINPKVRSAREREAVLPEGCLSLPAYEAFVRRPHTVSAEWTDETGRLRRETLQGLPAAVFQHELDHLDGVLIVDREISGMAGTRAAEEADRRYDEELERHYTGKRRAGSSKPRPDDV